MRSSSHRGIPGREAEEMPRMYVRSHHFRHARRAQPEDMPWSGGGA